MTPAARKRLLVRLTRDLSALSEKVERVAGTHRHADLTPAQQLTALHALAPAVASVREQFANLKGVLAAEAKSDLTHEQIAELLGVSKPYVQQMVYRGRKV